MSNGIDFPSPPQRVVHALPVERFEPASGRWMEVPLEPGAVRAQTLTLVTFNTWFQGPDHELRYGGVLDSLRQSDADIIFLQETTVALLNRLLATDWVRQRYAFARAPFRDDAIPSHGLMMLSRILPSRVALHPLPTHMGRWVLLADLNVNAVPLRVSTAHLESMKPYGDVRAQQLKSIFRLLEDARHAVLAGDFNFCSSWPEENDRIDPRYADLWAVLRPTEPGYTQDTDINPMLAAAKRTTKKVRFDRILMRSDAGHARWVPEHIELIGTAPVNPRLPKIFPSDHFGLRATVRCP